MISLPPGYHPADAERLVPEGTKQLTSASRGPFVRDRARVLHSGAFRHLAGKTQVVAPSEAAVPRTRLTHSLEVAQIAREIGQELGCDPDLADLAGLAHDIGHPPFGHNGERALDKVGAAAGGFEANAQNLRILTYLEQKVLDAQGISVGLNLTRAALDSVLKYPWTRPEGGGKFGVYAQQQAAFDWIRVGAPTVQRCMESQVMDWADDVAYSVHDVEDGVLSGRIDLTALRTAAQQDSVVTAGGTYLPGQADRFDDALQRLLGLELMTAAAHAADTAELPRALKTLTSELTGRFAGGPVQATRDCAGPGPLTRYGASLQIPEDLAAEVAVLKAIAFRYVMTDPKRLAQQRLESQVIDELVESLADRGGQDLEPLLRRDFHAADDDAGRLRAVLDQVALLTDAQAHRWHRAICGTGR